MSPTSRVITKHEELKKMSDPIVKAIVPAIVPASTPEPQQDDKALTEETLQDFVAAFNAGVAGMITPLKKRVKGIEEELASLANKTEKNDQKQTELALEIKEKMIAEQKKEIAETKLNLEKVLISIPELNKEIQQIFQIVTNLLKLYQTLFGKTSTETEAIIKLLEPKILALPNTSQNIVINSVKSVEPVKVTEVKPIEVKKG